MAYQHGLHIPKDSSHFMSAGCPFPDPVRATGRGVCMTTTNPSKPEPGSAEAIEPDEPRKTRGIRFSRSE